MLEFKHLFLTFIQRHTHFTFIINHMWFCLTTFTAKYSFYQNKKRNDNYDKNMYTLNDICQNVILSLRKTLDQFFLKSVHLTKYEKGGHHC